MKGLTMKKITLLITVLITVIMVVGCESDDPMLDSRYTLDNVIQMDVHYQGNYVLYWLDDDRFVLYEESPLDMFGKYNPDNDEESPMMFKDITGDIPLLANEEVIQIAHFGTSKTHPLGYVFLTSLGNVYTYHLGDTEFEEDYYIQGSNHNLIELEDNEKIISVKNDYAIASSALRFVTNMDNAYVFDKNLLNLGIWNFDASFFTEDETLLQTAFIGSNRSMLLLTSDQTVYQYFSKSQEYKNVTEYFPTNMNVDIVGFIYQQEFDGVYYVTSNGHVVEVDLNTIPTDYRVLDINLVENETIISIQQSQNECNEAVIFIQTSEDNIYLAEIPRDFVDSPGSDVVSLDVSELLNLSSTDIIEDIAFSNYVLGTCLRPIPYIGENTYIKHTIKITTQDHIYFIGYADNPMKLFKITVK